MAIPEQKEIGRPLLEYLKDKRLHHIEQISRYLEKHFKLTEAERKQEKSSGREPLFHNRIRWANFYLKKAGLVESVRGSGRTKITELGLELLEEEPQTIDNKFLMRYPAFVDYRNSVSKKK